MVILKCKMCGGDLTFEPGATVCECEFCGTKQTIPTADNEKKMTLFSRANRLLRNCEFDKAEGIFESIVAEFPEEAEAYWGLVLCKYGIEYVDDPASGKKVPTCHRSSFDSVMDDSDFEQVMENADTVARAIYREQAKQIEELRKGIIEVSGKEEPYDIFICYKETDENNDRTIDSVLAQDIYDALTSKGYRVFFSRISLEDKLGVEYEPFIFAALNSAKVMLAIGTSYDYYNAVWVKNEWGRYLKLMAADKSKYLIPCYKDIDAYDIPKEFTKLQAQDLGKVGAIQDLIRGIDKLFGKGGTIIHSQEIIQNKTNTTALLDRGKMALEDGAYDNAKTFFDQVLNTDSKCAEAYLGMAMACASASDIEIFGNMIANGLVCDNYYARAKQFGNPELLDRLKKYENLNSERIEKIELRRREIENEIDNITKKINDIDNSIFESQTRIQLKETQERIDWLNSEYSCLSFFDFKRKSEIEAELNIANEKINKLTIALNEEKAALTAQHDELLKKKNILIREKDDVGKPLETLSNNDNNIDEVKSISELLNYISIRISCSKDNDQKNVLTHLYKDIQRNSFSLDFETLKQNSISKLNELD